MGVSWDWDCGNPEEFSYLSQSVPMGIIASGPFFVLFSWLGALLLHGDYVCGYHTSMWEQSWNVDFILVRF